MPVLQKFHFSRNDKSQVLYHFEILTGQKPEPSEVAGFPTKTRVTREVPPDPQLQLIIGECIGGSVPVIFSSLVWHQPKALEILQGHKGLKSFA